MNKTQTNVDPQGTVEPKKTTNSPLFKGDYYRDTSVSEFEKAAEASQAIYDFIKSKQNKSNVEGKAQK